MYTHTHTHTHTHTYTHTCTVTCDHPPTQLFHGTVIVAMGSDSPPIEGQFIAYTCPLGFALTGPNMSVCMGNGEWEPDSGEVACIGDFALNILDTKSIHFN